MLRRRLLAVLGAGAVVTLAGCTTGADGGGDETTEANSSTTVAVESTDDYGDVLVDAEGVSLYVFDEDPAGESSCYDDCASTWPSLTVDGDPTAGAGVEADLGTTERDDGGTQVTADGRPLYYYANDSGPGDTSGQGVGDVWWLVAPDGSKINEPSADATTSGGGLY